MRGGGRVRYNILEAAARLGSVVHAKEGLEWRVETSAETFQEREVFLLFLNARAYA